MPKISFGIIALNAMPFLEYNLRALYPFAHEIIVVEGATRPAKSLARPDGHSSDRTLEMLQAFKQHNDPERKLHIIEATQAGYPDGFWPEKGEMSQAYAQRSTGNWLWQVDSDEFYHPEDMRTICNWLDTRGGVDGIILPFLEFWGGFDYVASGPWYLHEFTEVPRIFRWEPGFSYVDHRPPQVADRAGKILDRRNFIGAEEMRAHGIFMYHYSYVLPKQALQKVGYYANVDWTDAFRENEYWFQNQYSGLRNPMFLGERDSFQWLERFQGKHPKAIVQMQNDMASGKLVEELRPAADIERLLSSPVYKLQKLLARGFLQVYWPIRVVWKRIRAKLLNLFLTKQDRL